MFLTLGLSKFELSKYGIMVSDIDRENPPIAPIKNTAAPHLTTSDFGSTKKRINEIILQIINTKNILLHSAEAIKTKTDYIINFVQFKYFFAILLDILTFSATLLK